MIEYSPSTAECKNGTSDIHQAKEKYTDECFLDYNKRCAWEEGGTSQWNMKGISQFHRVHPSLCVGHVSHSVLHCKTCAPQSTPQACASNSITPCSQPLMLHAVFLTWYCHKQRTPILTIFISQYYITVTTFRNLNPSPHSSYLAALPYRRIVF